LVCSVEQTGRKRKDLPPGGSKPVTSIEGTCSVSSICGSWVGLHLEILSAFLRRDIQLTRNFERDGQLPECFL
jgi:hypothetical protein